MAAMERAPPSALSKTPFHLMLIRKQEAVYLLLLDAGAEKSDGSLCA